MKEEGNHRINTQLKMTSLEQVCFVCLFSFKISICNCYYELYKMAKKDDIIAAGMFHVHVYI